jgi:hypothetical protein
MVDSEQPKVPVSTEVRLVAPAPGTTYLSGTFPPLPRLSMEIERIISFLQELGLLVEVVGYEHPASFAPGVWLDEGRLFVCWCVATPGDILHEAGHLATIPSSFRHLIRPGSLPGPLLMAAIEDYIRTTGLVLDAFGTEDPVSRALLQMGDCEATAWSFAAARALDLDPGVLFAPRPDGTRPFGDQEAAEDVRSMLECSRYFGINGLQAAGYCTVREFPRMRRWLAV